jgi:hypothetical protein
MRFDPKTRLATTVPSDRNHRSTRGAAASTDTRLPPRTHWRWQVDLALRQPPPI